MTGEEMADCECPDRLTMLSYLSQVYDTFRGEIPHIKHPRIPQDVEEVDEEALNQPPKVNLSRVSKHTAPPRKRHSGENVNRTETPVRRNRKRRSEKLSFGGVSIFI